MVAAVSEAGVLGFIGAAYLSPQMIATACRDVQLRTGKPFGINLFAPLPVPDVPRNPDLALARLAPFHADLGLPPPELPVLAGRILRSAIGGRTWGAAHRCSASPSVRFPWQNPLLIACQAERLTLEDFQYFFGQCYYYSRNFTKMLTAALVNCDIDLHRSQLAANL